MDLNPFLDFANSISYDEVPDFAKYKTKSLLINFVGNAIGANNFSGSRNLILALSWMGKGESKILGYNGDFNLLSSVWANTSLSHFLDFDDTHLSTILHPSAPVFGSLIPLSILYEKTGTELLKIALIGIEFIIRIAKAFNLDKNVSPWHNTSLFGAPTSALVSSMLIGLEKEHMVNAIRQGFTFANGFSANHGTLSKSFQVGRSAAEGVIGAFAAKSWVNSSSDVMDVLAQALGSQPRTEELYHLLGQKWNVIDDYIKPYPCGVVLHPVIDCAVKIRSDIGDLSSVKSVEARVNPLVLKLTGIVEPRTGLEGKFSATYAIASALIFGKLTPSNFTDVSILDKRIGQLMKSVKLIPDSGVSRGQAHLTVFKTNGDILESHVNRGDNVPSEEMDDHSMAEKFNSLVVPVLGKTKSQKLLVSLNEVERFESVGKLKSLFVP